MKFPLNFTLGGANENHLAAHFTVVKFKPWLYDVPVSVKLVSGLLNTVTVTCVRHLRANVANVDTTATATCATIFAKQVPLQVM